MKARPLLWLLIAGHLALGLLYAWATPIFEASDEGHHVGVIQWLREGHGLPVQDPTRDREHPTIYAQEGSQPPLYYWLGWALTAPIPASDFEQAHVPNPMSRVGVPNTTHNPNLYRPQAAPGGTWTLTMALRLFSLLLSCGTIWLGHRLARQLSGREEVALLAAAFMAFNPMTLFINASANNDNLVMLLNTGALVSIAALWLTEGRPRARSLMGLGLWLGLAALTKLNGLVLWPVAALALGGRALTPERPANWRELLRAWLSPARWRSAAPLLARDLALTFAPALVVSGWWFARNLILYGELTGTATMVAIAGRRTIGLWDLITQEWYGFFLSYWGVFGGFTVLGPEWVNAAFAALTLGGLLGGGLALAAAWRADGWQRATPERGLGLLSLAFVGATLIALINWTSQTYASQGRLLFGAIAPLSAGLAYGWWVVGDRLRLTRWLWLLSSVLGGIALYLPIAIIAPAYQPPVAVAEADLPADVQRVEARLGSALELIGYRADGAPHRPGETLDFTVYWRVAAVVEADDVLALVASGRDGEVLTQVDTWPGGGLLPLSRFEPGVIYADNYTLPLAEAATAPTVITLRVGLWRDAPEHRLPTTDLSGAPIDDPALAIGRLIPATSEPTPEDLPGAGTTWGGVDATTASIRLDGLTLASDGALTLWWEGGGTPADATLFVHLLDASGRQIDQADGPPLAGFWPLTAWVPGQPFVEFRRFGNVTTLPAEANRVRLGWYDPASGARLPAWKPDGSRWPDDAAMVDVAP